MCESIRQQSVFVQRTQEAYQDQLRRARAAQENLDFGIEDIRPYVLNNLGPRACRYCLGPVTPANFALDLKNPPERGGSHIFHNLYVVCADCVAAKGLLDYIEYKELNALLRSWSPFMRRNLLARLRASSHIGDGLEFLPNPRLLA